MQEERDDSDELILTVYFFFSLGLGMSHPLLSHGDSTPCFGRISHPRVLGVDKLGTVSFTSFWTYSCIMMRALKVHV